MAARPFAVVPRCVAALAVVVVAAAVVVVVLAPVPPWPVTCADGGAAEAAILGVRHINEHHKHGFKFRLQEIVSSDYRQVPGGCDVVLSVKLVQTDCHVTNPKAHDRCDVFRQDERGAGATCTVELSVTSGVAAVTRHQCATRPDPSNEEMSWICPSCPGLLPLDDPTGAVAAQEAVIKFNRESKRRHYFTLLEMAHLTIEYIPSSGTMTLLKLALVETTCPREATHTFAPCTPLCPDRANHFFCSTSYYNLQEVLGELVCELYLPKNSTRLPAGEPEPSCGPLFHRSPEASACKAQLSDPDPSVHHICPFPLK
ncbi:antihemorrhagic factor cHLP-B-like [Phyllopteryx taeniolatus]|uniref:antihemorrhagic factor cHLP-B-like n=1 Tax=Phyllopteryx taeniolatus TaxID=161469 RepID=UPI002AD59B92|nr:antihemorrhagic factor cHLP-B-like [Phyllopteryx taeniolatus]XP_061635754.1 antihemorrhagic factor cHLP-B-like [Phyllopteryx taeniolatus]XP_061635756.1 antihemorrhagic factor cHLP-B-like [Phyllopteryx taeniolatus]